MLPSGPSGRVCPWLPGLLRVGTEKASGAQVPLTSGSGQGRAGPGEARPLLGRTAGPSSVGPLHGVRALLPLCVPSAVRRRGLFSVEVGRCRGRGQECDSGFLNVWILTCVKLSTPWTPITVSCLMK